MGAEVPLLDPAGRVAFVTGAARGIGLETARRLHARGACVALVGLEPAVLERQATALGERAACFEADVTDRAALARAVDGTLERFGAIDVVLANAGIAPPPDTILSVDPEAFERVLDVNLVGVWRTVKATLPHVIERRGHLLLVASLYAAVNGFMAAPYAASKAAVEALGRALRVELGPHGTTAGVAYFGFIDTDMVRDAFAAAAVGAARAALPAWMTRPIPLARAGAVIERGIERRSASVSAPRWVAPALALRGVIAPLDERLRADARLHAAVRMAEGESG